MNPTRQPVRLLLVEDHADTLDVLAMTLREHFGVVACRSAAEALVALETEPVDVALLDIGMAPMDGLQCIAAIRAMPGYAGLPAIALTAHARDVDRHSFLTAGFQAVVTKPVFDQRELVATIGTVLRSHVSGTRRPLTGHADPGILATDEAVGRSWPRAG